jgi:hypothetical protein
MKKLIFIFISAFLILNLSIGKSYAQEEKDFRYSIKTNPLAVLGGPFWILIVPITGEYRVMFEARTLPKQSVEIGLGYLGASSIINLGKLGDSISLSIGGFRGQIMYKFFITRDKAPKGFYVGPYFSYATATFRNGNKSSDNVTATKINGAIILGYQVITKGGFALDVFTGLGFKNIKYSVSLANKSTSFDMSNLTGKNGANVNFGLNFGFAF